MRLDLSVQLTYQSKTKILSVGIEYFVCELLLTSITMPDPEISEMRHT